MEPLKNEAKFSQEVYPKKVDWPYSLCILKFMLYDHINAMF